MYLRATSAIVLIVFSGPFMALGADYHYRYTDGDGSRGVDEIRVRFQAGF